jgi:hypothetical protein
MDFFQSRKLCPNRCYLTFFHFPERSIALVKRLAGSKGAEIDPTCLHANKVLLQGTRILIYIDGLLSVAQTVPNRCYLTFFHIPERSIALVKRLVHQRAEIDPNLPHANKVFAQVRILIYIDGLLSVAQTVPKPLLSYLLPFSRTFNC